MRDILFHGKCIDNGEWVIGWYVEACFGAWPLLPAIVPMNEARGGYRRDIEVDPDTVGQYTGLTDKNGKQIFEGDIVEYNGDIHKVVFEHRNGTAYFGIVISEIETWPFSNSVPSSVMNVIGNIHDNPELLA